MRLMSRSGTSHQRVVTVRVWFSVIVFVSPSSPQAHILCPARFIYLRVYVLFTGLIRCLNCYAQFVSVMSRDHAFLLRLVL